MDVPSHTGEGLSEGSYQVLQKPEQRDKFLLRVRRFFLDEVVFE